MVARIFIDGEAGTTGLQIRERLAGRRDIEVLSIDPDKRKDQDERKRLLNAADVAILCLPDDAARESVRLIENDTTRVIDASTAFRTDPDWTYGFAEMDKDQSERIAQARFVANPGCWPQGLIAALRPLVEARLVPPDYPVNYHGISGYTGGGKQMIAEYEGAAAPSQYMPYALTFAHKHLPEMALYARLNRTPLFEPVVGNFAQGMTTSVPLHLDLMADIPSGRDLHAALADNYAAIPESFVRVAPFDPTLSRNVALDPQMHNGTNTLTLHVFSNEERGQAVIAAVYDNLGKGASGAAVQNLNLMLGVGARESLAA
jgi:N-acetyl-gamma-glutamyl-phosphate reductase